MFNCPQKCVLVFRLMKYKVVRVRIVLGDYDGAIKERV